MEEYQAAGMLPVYDAGFITLDKQFRTIGINGMAEAAESHGIKVGYNDDYINFVQGRLKTIFEANQAASKHYGVKFNTEFVPAENLGVKNAKWDKADGYKVSRDCYNSYFYVVEDEEINALDKFLLHGKELVDWLDGGSALHLNLDEALPVFLLCHPFICDFGISEFQPVISATFDSNRCIPINRTAVAYLSISVISKTPYRAVFLYSG